MKNIEIIGSGKYLPKHKVENKVLSKELGVSEKFISERTGINTRYYSEDENIQDIATKSVEDLLKKNKNVNIKEVQMIIVATTSSDLLMPGISYKIQEEFNIENCMCMDILAGCAGYVNAFDIARNYIAIGKIENALIIGVDILSKYTNKEDIATSIVLSDGAGATIIQKSKDERIYNSKIVSNGKKGEILTCKSNEKIYMNGKEIYRYAVTETVKNIKQLLQESNIKIEEIKYIIPHQANIKIIKSIINRLKIEENKMYINIQKTGNTFCGSIPIALNDMIEQRLLHKKDKIILIGYGGGLNTASILMEV